MKRMTVVSAILMVAMALPLVFARPAFADDDHERARRAVEAGEVLPLRAVLAGIEETHPGHVLEVELEREDGRWIYEIKLMGREGDVVKLELDARDGRVLEVRGRNETEGAKR